MDIHKEMLYIFKNNIPLLDSSIVILPTVGNISAHAIKKGNKLRPNKREYLLLPYEFLAFLVGLIDGDGYIRINKTTKGYIALNLVLTLSLKDVSTLEYIYSVLKLGKITKYPDIKNPICKLVINRTDLQEVVFPLMIHHKLFFLTDSRKAQFDLAMFILQKDIKIYDEIPFLSCPGKACRGPLINYYTASRDNELSDLIHATYTGTDYLALPFFKNWLVGFTNAEGSFLIKKNNDCCFQLKQRIHIKLFEAFKTLFNTKRVIYIEKEKYAQFSVSSKKDIQEVVNFFSFSGLHPLIGLKSIQYFTWLASLRSSYRYHSLNLPSFANTKLPSITNCKGSPR